MNQTSHGLSVSLVIAVFGVVGGSARVLPGQDDAAAVVVTPVVAREVKTAHRAVGTVMPVRSSTVGSAVDGRVIEFPIDLGDAVQEGQTLVRLLTETLVIERAAADAELKLRQEELAELENGSRPEEIDEARARMRAAQATQRNTETSLKRTETLYERKAANETDLDDARERAEAAQQTFLAAEASLKRIEAGPRQEQIAQAQARVALQNEQVRLIEDRIAKYTIYAPFDGYIIAEHTEVGEWLSQGDPIAEVVALDVVDVRTNVPAEQVVQLESGRELNIEFPDLPIDVMTGRITRIVPTADARTRTFPVIVRLPNRIVNGVPLLMPGMLARVVLPTGETSRMPLVPKDAVVLNSSRRFVFVVETAGARAGLGRVRSVPVSLGVADGNLIQIDAAVHAGQLVVVLGNERLKDGQEVRFTRIEGETDSAAN